MSINATSKDLSFIHKDLLLDLNLINIITNVIVGVLLSLVVCVGLAGNFTSFLTLRRQVIQRIFHNLLFLLSIFDTVRKH